MKIRKSEDRGHADHGWLKSKHTFSFANYYDPEHMGYGTLRVINEDKVAPGAGFGMHSHQNMEIISYVLGGALEHKDTIGTGSVIQPGDIQRMSAGTGIAHSEYNHSKSKNVHFLQVWFVPKKLNIKPSYEQRSFSKEEKIGRLKLVVSETGREGSVSINQDIDMYVGLMENSNHVISHELKDNRNAWVYIARGSVELNGEALKAGDGAAMDIGEVLEFKNAKNAEVIVFDMLSSQF